MLSALLLFHASSITRLLLAISLLATCTASRRLSAPWIESFPEQQKDIGITSTCFGSRCIKRPSDHVEARPDEMRDIVTNNAVDIPFKRTVRFQDICGSFAEERGVGLFRTHSMPSCSCGIEYKPIDLGPDYYPRHINAVECLAGPCWRCVERKYKVAVLTRRKGISDDDDDDEEDTAEMPVVPEPLRGKFYFEQISVTVACDCSP